MQTKIQLRNRLNRYKKRTGLAWRKISNQSKLGIHWLSKFANIKDANYQYEYLVKLWKYLEARDIRQPGKTGTKTGPSSSS